MWKSAILILLLLVGCNASLPSFKELSQAQTREKLRNRIGEPDFIRSGGNYADVRSVDEPSINNRFPAIEVWEYNSVRNGVPGRAYFWFGVNDQTGDEVLGDKNWIADERSGLKAQR